MSDSLLNIETFVEPNFGENAFVISTTDERGGKVGWVIDPSFPPQVNQLLEYIYQQAIGIEKIILTHGHADHIAGLDYVYQAHREAGVLIGKGDKSMLADANKNLSGPFGMPLVLQTEADEDLEPSMSLILGQTTWKVLDTSGHSPGGRSLYCADAGVVIVGDALFAGSIGRTDFPGSDHQQLIANIRNHLLTLPDEIRVYTGHGPVTFIGNERKSNPYLSDG
ncbi:MAG: MBL fold metallo-hydrolase [Planctomycetota bacterium]|nr:MAG: MBL fold metallo-hydrolase [Planctomycetota bacterium]